MNPDKSPAQGVKVVVDPGNVEGYTAANGLAGLTLNSDVGARELVINVSLTLHFQLEFYSYLCEGLKLFKNLNTVTSKIVHVLFWGFFHSTLVGRGILHHRHGLTTLFLRVRGKLQTEW